MGYCHGVHRQRTEELEIGEYVALGHLIDGYRMVMKALESCMSKKDTEMIDDIKAEIENHVYYGKTA